MKQYNNDKRFETSKNLKLEQLIQSRFEDARAN